MRELNSPVVRSLRIKTCERDHVVQVELHKCDGQKVLEINHFTFTLIIRFYF